MLDKIVDAFIENRTFDELTIGESASSSHTVTQRDIDLFATVTGDVNPAHVDPAYAETDMFHHIIIQGMWGARPDFRCPWHEAAGSRDDLSWPGSAFPPSSFDRRHDYGDADREGEEA